MASRARPAGYRRALSNYLRRHVFVPRYRPDQALPLMTSDGVRLVGARVDGPPDAFCCVVLLHGLTNSLRNPEVFAFAQQLSSSVHVLVPGLRGHRGSGGVCSFGRDEPRDVEAAVRAAGELWPGLPVVTAGVSLGGAAALLHAAEYGGVAGVVAISSPAWATWDTPGTRRIRLWSSTRAGRAAMAGLLRTRVAAACEGLPDAKDAAASIAPAFVVLVHDPADHYFGPEHAEALYGWAKEPKALWWVEGAGHGTDLLTLSMGNRMLADLRVRLSGLGAGTEAG